MKKEVILSCGIKPKNYPWWNKPFIKLQIAYFPLLVVKNVCSTKMLVGKLDILALYIFLGNSFSTNMIIFIYLVKDYACDSKVNWKYVIEN